MFDSLNFDWGFLWDHNKPSLQKQFDEWLYGDWSKEKYEDYKLLSVIPFVGAYMDYKLSVRSDNEYLNRYGMDYSDIHDPRKLSQTSAAASVYGYGYRMISKNVSRLYQ